MKRLASQTMASADSVHRNIAEGYSRRSLKEYLQFVNYALGSLGETGSSVLAYLHAGQITESQADRIDERIYQVENELLSLCQSLINRSSEVKSDQAREPSPSYGKQNSDIHNLVTQLSFDLSEDELEVADIEIKEALAI